MGLMKKFVGILIMLLLGLQIPAYAADKLPAKLLVLIPKVNAAYDRVFNEIISGINTHQRVISNTFILTSTTRQNEIQQEIDAEHIDAIIALGQSSYDMANLFSNQVPVIHGGMIISPDGHSGISLTGSPKEFISHLKTIAPTVKRIYTVYSPENNSWIIEMARREANKNNIELHALEANSIRQAVNQFRNILEQTNGSFDAVWLLLDKIVPDQTILPLALEAAWKKQIVLFSSNPSHTKRGALFSLFPDHEKMGFDLAKFSLEQIESNQPRVLPLSSLKVSVNERTASHLGLRYTNTQLSSFDVIYPLR